MVIDNLQADRPGGALSFWGNNQFGISLGVGEETLAHCLEGDDSVPAPLVRQPKGRGACKPEFVKTLERP